MALRSYIIRTRDALVSFYFIYVNPQYLRCYQAYAPSNATLGYNCQAIYMQGWALLFYQYFSGDCYWFIPLVGFGGPNY